LDKAFAAKQKLAIGDSLWVQGRNFRVAGISEGTNAIVAQFAFTTLEDAQNLLGLPDIISFYLLTADRNTNGYVLIDSLKRRFSSFSIFSKREFMDNNLQEMQTGILPVLLTIALFGAIIGAAVITLMLYSSVLERREDYALLKAIGAGERFLAFLVIKQSLLGTIAGFLSGLLLNVIVAPLLVKLVPEITLLFTWKAVTAVFAVSLLIGLLGSLAPVHKLSRIYPAEVFRA
jgi:putative ABC transport system permease protein